MRAGNAGGRSLVAAIPTSRSVLMIGPYRLDLTRTPNDHFPFGRGGPHRCLGEWLARMEIRVLLQEWMRRVQTSEQTAPEQYLRSNFIAGIKHLPIRITPR